MCQTATCRHVRAESVLPPYSGRCSAPPLGLFRAISISGEVITQTGRPGYSTERVYAHYMPSMKSGGCFLMPRPPTATKVVIPTSVALQRLHDELPTDHFTLGWLMHSLQKRSFGMIMLLLALVA